MVWVLYVMFVKPVATGEWLDANNEQINYFYQDVPKGFGLIDDLNDIVV
jgi:hypothetical protein